jgi:hypothetical protein
MAPVCGVSAFKNLVVDARSTNMRASSGML